MGIAISTGGSHGIGATILEGARRSAAGQVVTTQSKSTSFLSRPGS